MILPRTCFCNLLIFKYFHIFTLRQIHANHWKNHLPPSLDGGNRQKELFEKIFSNPPSKDGGKLRKRLFFQESVFVNT
jgi:hypothetical protein